MSTPCPIRTAVYSNLVRENPLMCGVAFTSGVEQCAYERADVTGFHQVRRANSVLEVVHENQIEEKFRNWLVINPFPHGRFTP